MVAMGQCLVAAVAFGFAVAVPQRKLRSERSTETSILTHSGNATAAGNASKSGWSFETWYQAHSWGRGIWKWNNALAAYQRHFSCYIGQPVTIAEVGVQSGGSILMWHDVLGAQSVVYGLDINPATLRFAEQGRTVIALGDQGDPGMWRHFYGSTVASLDILVDDGGHEPHQMLVTLQETFPHINPGGFVSIEDIHGPEQYIHTFFTPAAQYLGVEAKAGNLDSVHVYPFVMIVQRAGGPSSHQIQFAGQEVQVSEFQHIWDAIATHQHWGNHIVLRNPTWGSLLTGQGLTNFFTYFQELHRWNWYDTPHGCSVTAAAVCTNQVQNCNVQAQVTGIHIYNDRLVVEVPSIPVNIQAVRRGTEWIGYGL